MGGGGGSGGDIFVCFLSSLSSTLPKSPWSLSFQTSLSLSVLFLSYTHHIHILVIIFATKHSSPRSQTRLGFVRIQQIFLPLTQTWTHQHNLNCSPKQTSSESLMSHICKVCSWSSSISPSLQTPLPRSNPIRTQKGGLRTYFRYTDKTSPQPT